VQAKAGFVTFRRERPKPDFISFPLAGGHNFHNLGGDSGWTATLGIRHVVTGSLSRSCAITYAGRGTGADHAIMEEAMSRMPTPLIEIDFTAEVVEWRGPAPFFFAAIPARHVDALREAARAASYGWGVVPVEARIGGAAFTTSLFPRDGGYLLPLKDAVRRAADITLGDRIAVHLAVKARRP